MPPPAPRPFNFAGLALAMIIGAIGIVGINLYSSGQFTNEVLLKRARAHFADALLSPRWLRHDSGFDPKPERVTAAAPTTQGSTTIASHQRRVVGLRPLNPANTPDGWEREALLGLQRGEAERHRHLDGDNASVFRYLAPLHAEAACLRCHGGQGFAENELIGGISISLDATDIDQYHRAHVSGSAVVIVLIMLGVGQVFYLSLGRVRAASDQTHRERKRFESLVQTMDGIVWEADPHTLQFTFVSRHAATLLGYPSSDWSAPGFWAARLHPEDRERALARRAEDARQLEPRELEYRFLSNDGRFVWLHDRSNLVLDDGRPSVLRGIMIDISQRKQAEEDATKLLRAVEQSPVSIIITNREGLIEYVNPRFSQLFGYARDEVLGRNPRLLTSGETPAETYRALWRTILSGAEWRGLLNNRCKDGHAICEEVSIAPVFGESGEITHFLAVEEDVTDKLRNEQELARYRDHLEDQVRARTEDLELAVHRASAADRAKTEFLTNMSHEIRTPLNAIIGFCGLAIDSGLPPRQAAYLRKIDDASRHLLQLVNNVLDVSKIAAGKIEIANADFDFLELVARLKESLGPQAAAKRLDLEFAIDPSLPARLHGDALRLHQVLLNLAHNAIKFTESGRVRVEVKLAHLDIASARVEFAVEDTGIGMDAEEIQRAFTPFAQGDASISRKYGGTGLGLTISRNLIGLMGGQLDTASVKGVGSRFGFALRFALAHAPAAPAPAGPTTETPHRFDRLRVLLVEDQELNRQLACELLAARGVAVVTAVNGREAVEHLFAEAPGAFDLVLMDLQMPEYDGLWATRQIRAHAGFESLPIVAMTAHVLEEERQRASAAGASDHLGKPYQPAQLYAVLRRWAPSAKMSPATDPGTGPTTDDGNANPSATAPTTAPTTAPSAAPSAEPTAPSPTFDPAVLDWAEGLERFSGNADKYRGWLRRFVVERRPVPDEAAALLAGGEAKTAAERAHSLKGVSGMLGLKRVFAAARDLEMACRQPADGRTGDVAGELDALRAAIDEAAGLIVALPAADEAAGANAKAP